MNDEGKECAAKRQTNGEAECEAEADGEGQKIRTAGTMCPPCGVCRQFMMEFCDPEGFQILLEDGKGGPNNQGDLIMSGPLNNS